MTSAIARAMRIALGAVGNFFADLLALFQSSATGSVDVNDSIMATVTIGVAASAYVDCDDSISADYGTALADSSLVSIVTVVASPNAICAVSDSRK